MSFFRVIVRLFHFNRTNWKAVTLCFVGAVVFWLFNSLNKTYSANIRFPVSFQFDEKNYSPGESLPDAVIMNVSGLGWDLMRKNFGMKLPVLEVPIDRPLETRKISGATLHGLLAGQMGSLQVNLVVTDTLYFQIEPKAIKKFGLIINTDKATFKDGYGIAGFPIAIPDSVVLEGPESIVYSFPDNIELSVDGRRLDTNQVEDVEVTIENVDLIKRDPPVVQVRYDVGRVESITRKIKVDLDSFKLISKPDSVVCVFNIPSKYTKRPNDLFTNARAVINSTNKERVLPIIKGLPPFVKLTHVDSVLVN